MCTPSLPESKAGKPCHHFAPRRLIARSSSTIRPQCFVPHLPNCIFPPTDHAQFDSFIRVSCFPCVFFGSRAVQIQSLFLPRSFRRIFSIGWSSYIAPSSGCLALWGAFPGISGHWRVFLWPFKTRPSAAHSFPLLLENRYFPNPPLLFSTDFFFLVAQSTVLTN